MSLNVLLGESRTATRWAGQTDVDCFDNFF